MTAPDPPWLAAKLLSVAIDADDRDTLLGDLLEEHASRACVSPPSAARWYWSQAIRSLPILLGRRAGRRQWISTIGIAIAAYPVVGGLNAAGMAAVQWCLDGQAPPNHIASALVGLAAISGGAHLASRIRPSAGELVGGLVMLAAVLMLLFPIDASPAWYQLIFLVLGPLAAHLGSATATRIVATPGQQ